MNNELQRKITSLTLMTIMLAGGMVIAAPGMVPAAHAANANLFVSAENSQFDNYMSGPQVIEVVVIDSDINDTDEAKGEPDVTVQGKDLRMVQAVDGNWYGYFADKKQALIADSTATSTGNGLDYGGFCDNSLVLTGDTNLAATGTLTLTGVTTADVLTLRGLTYTAVAGAPAGGGIEFSIDGDDTADAAALVAAINLQDGGTLTASNVGAVVTVVVDVAGLAGNTIANSGPASFTFEDPTLTGGLDDIDSFGTITIPGEITIGNILTIGGESFEATSGDAGANVYDVDPAGAGLDTIELAQAINDDSSLVDAVVNDDNTITLTAKTGTSAAAGDAITTVVTIDVTVVANQATLSGGTDLTAAEGDITLLDVQSVPLVTVNGLIYTAVDGASGATTFSVDTSDQATAVDLAATISADTRSGTEGDVVAVAVNNIVTITAVPSGTAGNTVNLIGDAGIVASGATLTGGTDVGAKAQTMNFQDTDGVYIQSTTGDNNAVNIASQGNADGTAPTAACGEIANGDGTDPGMNVLREAKKPNAGGNTVAVGQIGVDSEQWPFIQLYTLNPTGNVVVQYNKGGGAQSTTLTFDTVDQFAGASLDRSVYTTESQIHATITDLWLNIDPTDEDSWTFGTVGTLSTNYQVFDENGAGAGDAVGAGAGVIDISDKLGDLMCEDNCILRVNAAVQGSNKVVLTIQDNDDSDIALTTPGADVNVAGNFETANGNLAGTVPVTITEQGPNSGVFGTYDESDKSVLKITSDAKRGTSASIDYNETPVTILVGFDFATIDIQSIDDEWNSGEEIPLILIDGDANKNSRADEDLDLNNPEVLLIPSLSTGDPFTLGESGVGSETNAKAVFTNIGISTTASSDGDSVDATIVVDKFSDRAIISPDEGDAELASNLIIDYRTTVKELKETLLQNSLDDVHGFNFLNIDLRSLDAPGPFNVYLLVSTASNVNIIGTDGNKLVTATPILLTTATVNDQSFTQLSDAIVDSIIALDDNLIVGLGIEDPGFTDVNPTGSEAIVVDVFSFGFINDGLEGGERIANQIIRIEAEETGDNTSTFAGSLEYKMVNQLNILDVNTYSSLSPIANDPTFIVIEDLSDEDSIRVNYLDLGSDGVSTQIADQEEAPSHSGVVSFDADSYKTADTVTITLEDLDLNVDSDLIDIYTTVTTSTDENFDTIGSEDISTGGTSIELSNGDQLGRLLDITFDDARWTTPDDDTCTSDGKTTGDSLEDVIDDTGLGVTGFTLVETAKDSGVFMGDFQVPGTFCKEAGVDNTKPNAFQAVTGLDIEVNYVDFRDASGETIEVGDSAGVRANTGSVSLDRTVYPVPFGVPDNFGGPGTVSTPDGRALFPIHASGMSDDGSLSTGLDAGEFITGGDLSIHVRVNDPDFDISASGEDEIASNTAEGVGPVKISVIRGSSTVILGFAGGDSSSSGTIDTNGNDLLDVRSFGPMVEIAPDAGIFESDITIRYTDGPASTTCPNTTSEWTALDGSGSTEQINRFDVADGDQTGDFCILQGDILQVEYTDPADASGSVNTVTDSATFDLRNGVLQSDKSVYIIGSDMILTLIEPDFDLDNDQAETYDLDLIEWDSDAATISMGDAGGEAGKFDPEPLNFRETGDSTGIFQIVIEIPEVLDEDRLERGEEIVLEYTDWGPSGSDYVGDEDEDVNLTIFTSNFGATVELDQKVYTWTDKVYITIVAPDHNFDGDLIDEIGNSDFDPIKVSTRGFDIDNYKLVETGTDTGIFTGEVILTGFEHDADGDSTTGNNGNDVTFQSPSGKGPTDGLLPADDDDGFTVSFEFSEDETVVGSALIRWNIGEVQWLEASYPASGTGVIRIIDPDMNFNPESVDNFDVDVWSDSDAGGIDLTVTETNEATGIFEGTVFFTTTDESSGHRLRVAEGDTVTAEYEDNTLPDPYTTADELDVTATTLIGTVVPPLERAPAANLRTVDAFGNSLDTVQVDQQVQISADLANGQDREQSFAYLVQIQDGNGVTVSLAWITGSLSPGQSFSPALSWIPTESGAYTATAFVWESVDNPTALSPPVSTQINVR